MKEKLFQRKIEDFHCSKCGFSVEGTGYTDHCQRCLWSRHVDINPGDRKSNCTGMMEPIGIEIKSEKYIIHYKCEKCYFKHKIKSAKDDNIDEIIKLSQKSLC